MESTPNVQAEDDELDPSSLKFPPEEEASLLGEANALKATANNHFGSGNYTSAVESYNAALATCPAYLSSPRAVLHSNVAACHLKLSAWRDATDAATRAIECLDEVLRGTREGDETTKTRLEEDSTKASSAPKETDDDDVEEVVAPKEASQPKPAPPPPQDSDELRPIRIKALMRRAAARVEVGGWQDLAGAEEDYTILESIGSGLRDADRRLVRRKLAELPAKITTAREKEMGEMWGKLKELGNGLLRPFGMSTDNFQMVKDEKTGGYSMSFKQGGAE